MKLNACISNHEKKKAEIDNDIYKKLEFGVIWLIDFKHYQFFSTAALFFHFFFLDLSENDVNSEAYVIYAFLIHCYS